MRKSSRVKLGCGLGSWVLCHAVGESTCSLGRYCKLSANSVQTQNPLAIENLIALDASFLRVALLHVPGLYATSELPMSWGLFPIWNLTLAANIATCKRLKLVLRWCRNPKIPIFPFYVYADVCIAHFNTSDQLALGGDKLVYIKHFPTLWELSMRFFIRSVDDSSKNDL